MIGMIDELRYLFEASSARAHCPEIVQTLSERELLSIVPRYDGWIIGDDPATAAVFAAGKRGRLRAAVKWGVGTDNVDLGAAKQLGLPVTNTPGMFGKEVADLAMCYITALSRQTHLIDHEVKQGNWPKPRGISLAGKTVGIVGLGDIGRSLVKRALAADLRVIGYRNETQPDSIPSEVCIRDWPDSLQECDFLVFACALTAENRHMLNAETLAATKRGIRIVNVARGKLIDEAALVASLESGQVSSAALDVFEDEPLARQADIRRHPQCIFGSHNASNTVEAVRRASERAVQLLWSSLAEKRA